MEHYTVAVTCTNCNFCNLLRVKKGKPLHDVLCPTCGCESFLKLDTNSPPQVQKPLNDKLFDTAAWETFERTLDSLSKGLDKLFKK